MMMRPFLFLGQRPLRKVLMSGFSKQFKSKVFKINFFSGSRRVEDWFLRPTFLLQHEGKTNGISFNIRAIVNF